MAEGQETCSHCGAPRVPGYAACKFCKTPFVRNTQTNAIPCPRCNTLNETGAQKCVQCQTWIVVQCVFCSALSPHNVPACLKCGEAFAGAPERFAQRQSQQRVQQGLQIAGQVGHVAANVLGAAAAVGVLGGGHHQHVVHEHHYGGGGGHYGGNYGGGYDYGPPPPPPPESGGFFDNLFGGGSSDSGSSDSGGGFFDANSDSGGSDDSGSFFDDDS